MCTAISYTGKKHYFGRNLDLAYGYREQVTVTPRNYAFHFRNGNSLNHHYAMIGMATICENYPLYYEATNERGLSMAGLNFPGNAVYHAKISGKENLAPFEVIPWIVGQCASVREAKDMLMQINVWNLPFNRELPLTPLHWLVSDRVQSIVAEPMANGLVIQENPFGVLTNSPPFPYHLFRLSDYMSLSAGQSEKRFSEKIREPYSNGMGAMGLPGDYSSVSRFVRATFLKENSTAGDEDISHFFHLLNAVAMPRGSVLTDAGYQITRYSCCCDTDNGIYYYTTYDNSRPSAVDLHCCDLTADDLFSFRVLQQPDILWQNKWHT